MNGIWSTQELLSLAVTLAVIIDPLAAAGIFLGLTHDFAPALRRRIAVHAHLIAAATLVLFAAGGGEILRLLGISLPAFRIAGGLLLLLIAVEMVFGQRGERRSRDAEKALSERQGSEAQRGVHEIAVFPVGIPLLAGPGAIAAVLLLSAGPHGDSLAGMALLAGMLLAILLASLLLFLAANRLGGVLGDSVVLVVTRLLGIVMAALAVQFVIDGISASFGL